MPLKALHFSMLQPNIVDPDGLVTPTGNDKLAVSGGRDTQYLAVARLLRAVGESAPTWPNEGFLFSSFCVPADD